jgi:WD40 repeat protein
VCVCVCVCVGAIYTVAPGDEGKASVQEVRSAGMHTGVVYSVCWSSKHNIVASGGADCTCR